MEISKKLEALLLYNEKRTQAFVDSKEKVNEETNKINKRLEVALQCALNQTQALITEEMRECVRAKAYTTQCSLCGWYGPLDSHRLVPGKDGGEYVLGNVINICPNCHRLLHCYQSQTTCESI